MRLNVELQKLGVLGRAIFWASGDGGVLSPYNRYVIFVSRIILYVNIYVYVTYILCGAGRRWV